MNPSRKKPAARRRPAGKQTFTTKSGNTIKFNQSFSDRIRANRAAKARRRAAYLSTLPQNPWKRLAYRLHPKRVIKYWFSRDGAIMALKLAGIGIVVCFILLVGVFAYFRKDLPNIKDISGTNIGGSITYYDRTGKTVLFQDYDAVKRIPVSADAIHDNVRNATIAIEDKDFYKHGAFDVRGITRAGIHDVFGGGGVTQGGSTITQQLVKLNQDWTADRTITRKFKEVILAVELEREYSKDDILNGYLNIAPYGNIQYGVESASRDYFGKSAKDLTLPEAALLAAIPQAPSYYSPYGPIYDAGALVGRQHYILDQMAKQKMITKEEAEAAKSVDVLSTIRPSTPKYDGIKAPYFVLAAKQELEEKYGSKTVQRGGWKVTTTLDTRLQELAEKQVTKGIAQVKKQKGDVAAFAAIDVKTAQMVALVGGPDFSNPTYGQVNYAKQWLPPGSSFKPYDYVSLINDSNNTGAGSVLYDTQAALPGWPCTNKARPKDGGNCLWDYDFKYPGPLTVRYALGGSRNVPAVKAMLTVGVNKVIANAEAMGLKSGYKCFQDEQLTKEGQCYGSAAIGDGAYLKLDDHVNGIASIARLGKSIPKTYIIKITDASNKVLDEFKQPAGKQVVRPDSAYIVTNMAADPNASYLPSGYYKFHRYKGWDFAIKTGTTNDGYDGLMASWSTQYTAVAWVGYHTRNKAMHGPGMEYMTTPIIRTWMQQAHDALGTSAVNWTKPSGVKTAPSYVITNHIGIGSVEPSPSTDLYPSWYVPPTKGGTSQTIDLVSNKLATSCTPPAAKKVQGGANANIFSVDVFASVTGSTSATVEGNDDVHNCNDAKPTINLTTPNKCNSVSTCKFTVTVSQGTHALSGGTYTAAPAGQVTLIVNGQAVQTVTMDAGDLWTREFTYTPADGQTGPIEVQAKAVDSVLYETTSSSNTVTISKPAGDDDT